MITVLVDARVPALLVASLEAAAPDMRFTDDVRAEHDALLTYCKGVATGGLPRVAISPDGSRIELTDVTVAPDDIVALIRNAVHSGEVTWTH